MQTSDQAALDSDAAAAPAPMFFHEFNRMAPPIKVDWECTPDQASQLTKRVGETWEELGRERPHWSVLSTDDFLPERIAQSDREFFESGRYDCDRLTAALARCGYRAEQMRTVLEFGCGLGRITNYLAERFARVLARDISRPHLQIAAVNSLKLGLKNIDYGIAQIPDFGMREPFDLWYSVIVLQHNPPPIMAAILRQTFTMLRPGGVAVFQIPTYMKDYNFSLTDYLAVPLPENSFEMHCLPQRAIFAIAADAGCRVMEVTEDNAVGNLDWLSNLIVIGKPQ